MARRLLLNGAVLGLVASSAVVGAVARAAADDGPLGAAQAVVLEANPDDPRVLEAGLWRTELPPNPANPRWFRYQRTSDNSTLHVSVTAVGGIRDGFALRATARGQDCGNVSQTGSWDATGAHVVLGGQLRVAGRLDSPCLNSRTVDFALERAASSEVDEELEVLVTVVEEVVLDDLYGVLNGDTDLPEPPDEEPAIDVPEPGSVREVQPGAGFDTALHTDGGTHRATIGQGENHFYAVDLDWGQTVAVRLDVPRVELEEDAVFFGPDLAVAVHNPLRNDVDATLADVDPEVTLDDEEAVTATTGYGPVNWLARNDGPAPLPGTHWVVVTMEGQSDGADEPPLQTSYDLTIEVQGERTGVPEFKGTTRPFLVAPATWSEHASGRARATEVGEEFWTARRFGALGLGVLGVLCLALGGLQLRRHRG